MNILAESENYIITNDYEVVYLKIKDTNKLIMIGDFYGDPEMALISEDESLCAICGSGIIIYYLKDPYIPYNYSINNTQWIEYGKDVNKEIWISNIQLIDTNLIEITTENDDKMILYIIENEIIVREVNKQ